MASLEINRHDHPSLEVAAERGKPGPAEPKDTEDRAVTGTAPTVDQMRDQIEASFAADVRVTPSEDRAPDLEKRMRAVIPAGSSVRSLECRQALCRVETVHPSVEAYRDFVQHGYVTLDFATRVSNGPVFVALLAPPVEGQPVVGVAFLGRDGAVLPTTTVASAGDH